MFSKFGNSWQLVKASWAVLKSDKELVWFPIISSITMIIVTIFFLIPIGAILSAVGFFTGTYDGAGMEIIGFIFTFFFYLVTSIIVIFFNTALIGAAMIRLDGGDPSLADGFNIARSRLGTIVGYALITATVGMILRMIEERLGFLGQIISWLGGLAWGMATFLVVPVLVVNDVTPIEAIKRSASLLRETWGEQVIGSFGIGTIFGIFYMLVIVAGVALIMTFASIESGVLVAVAVVL
ncbi:MAG: DUF6159 family protein, partial [Aggregatilineales bacterium]